MYEGGEGVPQDLGLARDFYERACRGGLLESCDAVRALDLSGR